MQVSGHVLEWINYIDFCHKCVEIDQGIEKASLYSSVLPPFLSPSGKEEKYHHISHFTSTNQTELNVILCNLT